MPFLPKKTLEDALKEAQISFDKDMKAFSKDLLKKDESYIEELENKNKQLVIENNQLKEKLKQYEQFVNKL